MTDAIPLDQLRVASPCDMNWNDLRGDGAVRHCDRCNLSVHNLSAMSRSEVADLLGNSEGRVCGMFYRRPDGTIVTRDCPVGRRAMRARVRARLIQAAAAIGVLLTGALALAKGQREGDVSSMRSHQPFKSVCDRLSPLPLPAPPPPVMGRMFIGDIEIPSPGASGGNQECE